MKTALVLVTVAFVVQACTIMDGEESLISKQQAGTGAPSPQTTAVKPDVPSHSGQQETPDAGHTLPTPGPTTPSATDQIECGGKTCSGATPYCCAGVGSADCVDANTTVCTQDRFLMRCDSPSDCGQGEVCCAWWDNNSTTLVWESACMVGSACVPWWSDDGAQAAVHMCKTDADCNGKTCSDPIQNYDGTNLPVTSKFCAL